MRKFAALLLIALMPVVLLAPVTGCGPKKTTTVRQHEERHESEPRMTSPGTEVVE